MKKALLSGIGFLLVIAGMALTLRSPIARPIGLRGFPSN